MARRAYPQDDIVQTYEKRLSAVRWWAGLICCFHCIAVLLAGLLFIHYGFLRRTAERLSMVLPSSLYFNDYFILLLAGSNVTLSCRFFVRRFRRLLQLHVYGFQDPLSLEQIYKISNTEKHLQAIFFSCLGLLMVERGYRILESVHNINSSNVNGWIVFYRLAGAFSAVMLSKYSIILNAWIALEKPPFRGEQSIQTYFLYALGELPQDEGFVFAADEDGFFRFAFKMLGSEFRQNMKPETVAINHEMLIQYMYAHKRGMEYVESYMDAEDTFEQLAAVTMVGFWDDALCASTMKLD